ncbi:hypothetical protein ABIE27_004439 [Paenibacillus sp. 4624]|uniref:Uncharacterized protein n=1 Tax=Paenibacillus amylolyticus TaxID=1451 RepID=A0A5M9WP68_PAEAM|nr:hypothetical protein EC604_05960 [Paenibacillus amylolyticus]
MDFLENTRWMVSVQTEPSSESGTAEGRITRRLFDETAGYLFLLPAAGWAKWNNHMDASLIRKSGTTVHGVSRRTL